MGPSPVSNPAMCPTSVHGQVSRSKVVLGPGTFASNSPILLPGNPATDNQYVYHLLREMIMYHAAKFRANN